MLRVRHLRSQALAQHVEAFQLRPSRELLAQSAVHLGAQGVERIQPTFEVLDDPSSWLERGKPPGQIVDCLGDALRRRRTGFSRSDLIRQCVDLRLDLRSLTHEAARPVEEPLDLALVRTKLVEERRGLLVGGMNGLDLGLQRVEVFAVLRQAVELPLRAFGRCLQAVQPLLERGERRLLSLQ